MFCPSCFIEIKETRTLDEPGYVYSYTTVSRNRTGEKNGPVTIALVKYEAVKGGIVHRLDTTAADNVAFGMKVLPVMKSEAERNGSLTDIISFRQA